MRFIFEVNLYIQAKSDYNQGVFGGFRLDGMNTGWLDFAHSGRKSFFSSGYEAQVYLFGVVLRRKKPLFLERPCGWWSSMSPFILTEMPYFPLFIPSANTVL